MSNTNLMYKLKELVELEVKEVIQLNISMK